ncbi:DUF6447 family protein [Prosthecochloris sp. CIB 2401]|uniref:DUF6447 family protein n=1 Tax=Prosthecochloris sp. CIB 2401 TaxID=1868325 RepID=UPI00080AAEDD|nr:DUF6447 family protein [Prosthecochloris sp. CIB 2401]ANT64113.1 hypothetical protein Ptc2401_00312 [Prosthecochloris sp. CIB 2401]
MAEKQPATLKVNGTEYNVDNLSKEAKEQLVNLRFAETEVRRLQAQLAMAQTARNAYQQALMMQLPKKEEAEVSEEG